MNLPARTYFIEKEIRLPRQKVWELLADTDHLNRVIGLFAVTSGKAVATVGTGGFTKPVAARAAGFVPLKWNESPFKWTKNVYYSVVRRYVGGPMKQFYGGVRLSDGPTVLSGGTRSTIVHLFAEFTPRNIVGVAAIPVVGQGSMKNTMRYLTDYLDANRDGAIELLPQPKSEYRIDAQRLERLLREMRALPVAEEISRCFSVHVRRGGDDEVIDMNAYSLAARWKQAREEVLRWFLYATKVGITNLSWHLICPNCRVAKVDAPALANVTEQFHCDFCGINYKANFDKYVELVFSVHPDIRRAEKYVYCVGGPTITPHIFVQLVVDAGSEEAMDVPDGVREYRIRVLQRNHMVSVAAGDGIPGRVAPAGGTADTPLLMYRDRGWDTVALSLPPGAASVRIRNESAEDIVVAAEKTDWSDDAVTAAKVTTMSEFRRMFSSEVLAPGQNIGVESVTLMFTDLLSSTAFYESAGDAPAYGQVRRHFEFLGHWIAAWNGTIVKTIGDAVMAAFLTPEDAFEAAMSIQEHVGEFNRDESAVEPIVVKIGLHQGPAIAVNSNDRLDYFGRTVNIAARIQGLSAGGDVVISEPLAERSAIRGRIGRSGARVDAFEAELKGIEGATRLHRVIPRETPELTRASG